MWQAPPQLERFLFKPRRPMWGAPVWVWVAALLPLGLALGWSGDRAMKQVQPIRDRVIFQHFFAIETTEGELVPVDPTSGDGRIGELRAAGRVAAVHVLRVRLQRSAATAWGTHTLADPIERWSLVIIGAYTEVRSQSFEMTPADRARMFELQRQELGTVEMVPDAAELFRQGLGTYRRLLPGVLAIDAAVVGSWLVGLVWLMGCGRMFVRYGWEVRHKRAVMGLCPECRYDLAAWMGGRCPECGQVPTAEEAALLGVSASMKE